jgi:hypothetical protein
MMRNLTTKLIVAAVIIMAVVGSGCPDGSPVVRFINGMDIELYRTGGRFNQLDVWDTDGAEDIYGAGFGYKCRVQANGIPLSGIKVECQIISHSDPLDIGEDIWDEYTPNGERYGYVHSLPNGSWDRDEGMAKAYTDASGECVFLIGLGDPDVGFEAGDVGYVWPDGKDGVSTFVELRFVIQKATGNIINDCYVVFFRSQYQNFWEPFGGVFEHSFSSLSEWDGWDGWPTISDKSGGEGAAEHLGPVGEFDLTEAASIKKVPYPRLSFAKSGAPSPDWIVVYDPNCVFIPGPLVIDPNCPWIVDPNCIWPDIINPIPDPNCPGWFIDPDCPDYPDPNCPWLYDPVCMVTEPNCYILDPDWPWIAGPMVPDPNCYTYFDPNEGVLPEVPMSGEGWEYLDGIWQKWYPYYGWDYINGVVATWISNIDDSNEVTLAMDLSQPYVFLCRWEVEEIGSVQTFQHTGVVISKDALGRKVSEMPIKLHVYQFWGNTVYLATDYILPMEFPEQQGEYYDSWGNSIAAIYVPEGGRLEITGDSFYGDFNYDGYVDNKDYGLFAARWNDDVFGLYDPNFAYDLMYDADYDGQTDISDLMWFSDNWLEGR